MPRANIASLARHLLDVDADAPPWFLTWMQMAIGREQLERLLLDRPRPRIARAAIPWMAANGSVAGLLELRRQILGPSTSIDPSIESMRPLLGFPTRLALAQDIAGKRAQAERLTQAGLPLPPELSRDLARGGQPWSGWSAPVSLADDACRKRLKGALTDAQVYPWARTWLDRIDVAERAIARGDTFGLDAGSDPDVILAAISSAKPSEAARLRSLLEACATPVWKHLDGGVRWTWLWVSEDQRPPLPRPERWCGLVIDGAWAGWIRGEIDRSRLPPGLHRLAVLRIP